MPFRRIMRACEVICALLMAEVCSPAFAGEIHYANTCLVRESGDLAGYVVIVSEAEPLPSVSLSWSEGALMLPVAAIVTDYDRRSGRLAFSVHVDQGEIHFEGKLGPDRIQGIISAPWERSPQPVELQVRSREIAFRPNGPCR